MKYLAPQYRHRSSLYILLPGLLLTGYLGYLAGMRTTPEPSLSCKLWQVLSENLPLDGWGESLQAWTASNMACIHPKAGDVGRKAQTVQIFLDTQSPTLRSHSLRYIVIEARGGILNGSDKIDSFGEPITPFLQIYARAIVGIQYGPREKSEPSRGDSDRIVFCQWTVTTMAGRPVPPNTVQAIVIALQRTEKQRESKVLHLQVPTKYVGLVNGPGLWSEIMMESLSMATGTKLSNPNVTGLLEPRLFGDLLILPVDPLRPHSGYPPDSLVRQQLRLSWRSG